MKSLPVLVLLSSAVLLCSAAPALEEVKCRADNNDAASRHAMHHINEHHQHGYKFKLDAVQDIKVDLHEENCAIELHLDLLETVCHVVNPKHFEDCEARQETDQEVIANCTVLMTVTTSGTTVDRYDCNTRQAKRHLMVRICPDCPVLISLNDPEGLKAVHDAVEKFHEQDTSERYYILQEVARIKSGWMMMGGMAYYPHFVLVETDCSKQSKIVPSACKPLCPDRAHHAYCRSSAIEELGLNSVDCEYYSPVNTTALGPGEQELICEPPHAHGHGPPPHGHGHGPPPHPGTGGPPPHGHGHGPPPHAHGHGPPPHAGSGGPPPHAHGHGPPPHAGSGGPPPHGHGHGPPPHAHGHSHGHGPPPHAHGHGPPPHAGSGGPPPTTGIEGSSQERVLFLPPPFFPPHHCQRLQTDPDPAIHPICSWPHPEPPLTPRQS
ncbi:alpha-2-HS-glycoprotein 1 [Echeneis naucrates]|uniref:alpha-2-HS-glycoprotein 1 n=1 Tax=Echeneis naucrates TaxID=173247 RepID=UPI001113CF30|nr:histidine-rich glycoprotein-like [Echeneis naucrates]